ARDSTRTGGWLVVLGSNCPGDWRGLAKILEGSRAPLVSSCLLFNEFVILRSSGLKIEHYPCWRMVAGVYLPTRPSVYTSVHESVRHVRREQKVIESHAFVLRPPFKFVVPEGPEGPVRMESPHGVGPALSQQARKGLAA